MGKSNEKKVEVSNVTSGSIIPAPAGWSVYIILKDQDGKEFTKIYLVAAFKNFTSEEGWDVLSPIMFNEDMQGLTLDEIQAMLESEGLEVVNVMMYCGTDRAVSRKRS